MAPSAAGQLRGVRPHLHHGSSRSEPASEDSLSPRRPSHPLRHGAPRSGVAPWGSNPPPSRFEPTRARERRQPEPAKAIPPSPPWRPAQRGSAVGFEPTSITVRAEASTRAKAIPPRSLRAFGDPVTEAVTRSGTFVQY
jgi:hypothetical protein